MALEIKLKYSVTSDVTQIKVEDITGAYDLNNPTGWGTPNTERNNVALVLYAKYQPFEKPALNLSLLNPASKMELYDVAYLNTDPSEYLLTYHADGWYKFYLVAVPVINISPEENDIIYNTAQEVMKIYRGGFFVDLESADWEYLINEEKYELGFLEDIVLSKLIIQRNCQLEKYISCMECTSCKCNDIKEEYVRLDALIQATDYRFHSEKQSEAQKMTEKLTKDYKCCK